LDFVTFICEAILTAKYGWFAEQDYRFQGHTAAYLSFHSNCWARGNEALFDTERD
jgi:hypothetical protein